MSIKECALLMDQVKDLQEEIALLNSTINLLRDQKAAANDLAEARLHLVIKHQPTVTAAIALVNAREGRHALYLTLVEKVKAMS